ncbi:MAG: prepilin-type N-terminal cleavage/methylation domain-containing protein [Sedimentisphaerales bacterium]|nr:prepilin-type N-terminal cleavage/methylation domain-containing protein [Sedimentisphaerales bacterium]
MAELCSDRRIRGFTLIEVLIALAITVIGLVPLLHLLTTSIFMTDSAWNLSQATLLGNAKLAEVIAQNNIEIGTKKGSIESEEKEMAFDWKSEVTEAPIEELEGMSLPDLLKVTVDVMWYEGKKQKQVSLMTYVFIDKTVTKISAN